MTRALADMESLVRGLHTADNPVAEGLEKEILKVVELGRKQVAAVFAANARIGTVGDIVMKGDETG